MHGSNYASPFKKWVLKNDVDGWEGWNTIPDKRFEIISNVTLFRPILQSASLQSFGTKLRRCPLVPQENHIDQKKSCRVEMLPMCLTNVLTKYKTFHSEKDLPQSENLFLLLLMKERRLNVCMFQL